MQDLQWAAQFGAVFVLAVVIFHFYRQDRKDSEAKYENLVDRMLASRAESDKRLSEVTNEFRDIVRENAGAFSQVSATLQNLVEHSGYQKPKH